MFRTLLKAEKGDSFDVIVVCLRRNFIERRTICVSECYSSGGDARYHDHKILKLQEPFYIGEVCIDDFYIRTYAHEDAYERKIATFGEFFKIYFLHGIRRYENELQLHFDIIPFQECLLEEFEKTVLELNAELAKHAAFLEECREKKIEINPYAPDPRYGKNGTVTKLFQTFKEKTEQLLRDN